MDSLNFLIILITICINDAIANQDDNNYKKIIDSILQDYDRRARPVSPDNGVLNVSLDVDLYFIQTLVNINKQKCNFYFKPE
jgi:hypothetical protein